MPASNKVGTQLLVSPFIRDTARGLALVRQESVAEIWRAALEPALEKAAAETPVLTEIYQSIRPAIDAVVRDVTREYGSTAEVYREALEPAVETLRERHAPALHRLHEALDSMGVERSAGLAAMIRQRIRYGDLFEPNGQPKSHFPGTVG